MKTLPRYLVTLGVGLCAVLVCMSGASAKSCLDTFMSLDPAVVTQDLLDAVANRPENTNSEKADKEQAACEQLAGVIRSRLADEMNRKVRVATVSEDQLSSTISPMRPGVAGSNAQPTAAPDLHSVELAGGAITLAGGVNDTEAIASVSINPAGLATRGTKDFAWGSRLMDVSVLVPVALDRLTDGQSGDAFDYLGIRVRSNLLGLRADATELEDTLGDVRDAQLKALSEGGNFEQDLADVLGRVRDPEACFAAYMADDERAFQSLCEQVDASKFISAEKDLQAAVDEWRNTADGFFLGVDARMDFGDPGPEDSTTFGFTGVLAGGGNQFWDGGHSFQWRLNAGGSVRRVKKSVRRATRLAGLNPEDTVSQVGGGFGLTYSAAITDAASLGISAGVEGYYAVERDAEGPDHDDSLTFIGAIEVPIAGESGLTLSVQVPLLADDERGVVAGVSYDWALLARFLSGR